MTNSVVDRVAFDGSNLSGVNFTNAVITGATFKGTDLSGASFEDALIGNEDAKRLCAPNLSLTLNSGKTDPSSCGTHVVCCVYFMLIQKYVVAQPRRARARATPAVLTRPDDT